MASVNYYLRRSKKGDKADQSIYLFFSYDNHRLRLSTGEKINPRFWNNATQRAKETKQYPQYLEFNKRLRDLENGIMDIHRRGINDGAEVNDSYLKDEFQRFVKTLNGEKIEERAERPDLIRFIETFIETQRSFKEPSTIKTYLSTLNHLRGFQERHRTKLDFDSIDLTFHEKFLQYLLHEAHLSNNTAGKYIATLKVFLNDATDKGINANLDFKKRKFKATREESDSIYLTEQELEKLYVLDLSKNPRLERVRDQFIVGCYTGLRFSDLSRIAEQNIRGNSIYLRTKKMDDAVVIPIHRYVRELIDKYENKLPSALSNQKMNDYLKELGELAGIEEELLIRRTKGGQRFHKKHKKHELITTHTARRSFATNAFLAGVPSISIMKITGHRSERQFMRYIKMSGEDNARKLHNHPFFSSEPQLKKA